jgi:methionine-rich copper-binding protein CopC
VANTPSLTDRRHCKWGRAAGVVLLSSLAILLGPLAGQAQAHAELTGSSPGEGAILDKAPSRVVLVFDEDVQTKFADIVVTAPDGAGIATGDVAVTANRVVATVGRPTAAGDYKVAWRVVSDDGHAVDGQFTYTLTRHALTTGQVAAPVVRVPTTTGASETGATTTGSSGSWAAQHVAVLAIGAAVVVAVGLLLLLRQRQHGR